jgi:hypothetical protein
VRRTEERSEQWKALRRGWCLGEEQFRKELLEQVHERAGVHHCGEEIGQAAEDQARRIIAEELAKLGWTERHLSERRKGDSGKIGIARRLRRETTVSKRWIAEQLSMGSVSNVTFCLQEDGKKPLLIIWPDPKFTNSIEGKIFQRQRGFTEHAPGRNLQKHETGCFGGLHNEQRFHASRELCLACRNVPPPTGGRLFALSV